MTFDARAWAAEYQQNKAARRKAEGVCVACARPLDREGVYCVACNERSALRILALHRRRLDAGLCRRCGAPKSPTTTFCEEHRAEINARHEWKRVETLAETKFSACGEFGCAPSLHFAKGLCFLCASPRRGGPRVNGQALCEAHYTQRMAEYRARALARGMCARCARRPLDPSSRSRCRKCLDYAAAHERKRAQKGKRGKRAA